ncbi:MAG: hypothetical protein U5O69_04895 [Candidatus Competibacteraceae bacterium]|nr:hypothetical protein [Candidatus Competibacteraceae bacterium]
MQALAGKTILQLRKRLGEDWPDLALYFDIPRERCKGFAPGRECDGVVAWLKEQERLGELTEGGCCSPLDRDDLYPLLLEIIAKPRFPDDRSVDLAAFAVSGPAALQSRGCADLFWPPPGKPQPV